MRSFIYGLCILLVSSSVVYAMRVFPQEANSTADGAVALCSIR